MNPYIQRCGRPYRHLAHEWEDWMDGRLWQVHECDGNSDDDEDNHEHQDELYETGRYE